MTTTIIMKDELRQSVETASEGRQTVLRTSKGHPSYFNVIPAFKCEDISPELGTGLHPAFIVNGVEKKEILIGTYQAMIQDGQAVSLPGRDPKVYINFDDARAACTAAGPGFHLMTNWEWAAVALWMAKHGYGAARGNTDFGKSHSHPEEVGQPGGTGRILTGSGPASWRHDGTMFGIADLVGNVWEWNDGLKLTEGKIIIPADNAFGLTESEWLDTGAVIDFADGLQISNQISERDWDGEPFNTVAAKAGYTAPITLKQALLCPLGGTLLSGHFWADNSEGFEVLPFRGGGWDVGGSAGLAALVLLYGRSVAHLDFGFRPAFIG